MAEAIVTEWAAEKIIDSDNPLKLIDEISRSVGRDEGVRFVMLRGEHHRAVQGLSSWNGVPPVWKPCSTLTLSTIKLPRPTSEYTKSLDVEIVTGIRES